MPLSFGRARPVQQKKQESNCQKRQIYYPFVNFVILETITDKTVSQWSEAQALERVIEEMDVRKCALIDPSLLLEDIEPSYSNYTNNYSTVLEEGVDNKFNDMAGSCSQSRS